MAHRDTWIQQSHLYVISSSNAFPTLKSQHVCCEKGLLTLNIIKPQNNYKSIYVFSLLQNYNIILFSKKMNFSIFIPHIPWQLQETSSGWESLDMDFIPWVEWYYCISPHSAGHTWFLPPEGRRGSIKSSYRTIVLEGGDEGDLRGKQK